jgi:hypothetical protein
MAHWSLEALGLGQAPNPWQVSAADRAESLGAAVLPSSLPNDYQRPNTAQASRSRPAYDEAGSQANCQAKPHYRRDIGSAANPARDIASVAWP